MIKSSLDKLAEVEDIDVVWRSYELRPAGDPPMPPEYESTYRDKIAAAWPNTKRTAFEQFGVTMEYHRWGIKSRIAHEGAKYAEANGFGEAYHNAMFQAHFIEDRDFGDVDVLTTIAGELGMDEHEFRQVIENGVYAEAVEQDVAQAKAYGLSGVPATIIQDKYLVSGGLPFDNLKDVVRQVKAKEQELSDDQSS